MSDPYSSGPYPPQPYAHAYGTTWGGAPAYVTDRREVDLAVVVIAWVLAVLSGFYMLPWAVAATRGRSNHGMIALLNFLLLSLVIWLSALTSVREARRATHGRCR